MVISASYRTDIPGFYANWFERRLRAGYCLVSHPVTGAPRRVPLTAPEVTGYLFWTRNVAPFRHILARLALDEMPFVVHYTLTGYPRELEERVPHVERAVSLIWELADRFGEAVPVWRYDPILVTGLTECEWHRRQFETLAGRLAGAVDEVVVSFCSMYQKTRGNLRRAGQAHQFNVEDPPVEEKQALLLDLARIAAGYGMRLTVCAQRDLLVHGLEDSICVDPRRLSRVAGRPLTIPHQAHREHCGCYQSTDIGAYDTCPAGCVYCYAVRRQEVAAGRFAEHRVDDVILWRPEKLRALTTRQLEALAAGQEDPLRDQMALFDWSD